jgi:hypothetical protein
MIKGAFYERAEPGPALCRVCHRPLYGAKSIAAGVGPSCAKRGAKDTKTQDMWG